MQLIVPPKQVFSAASGRMGEGSLIAIKLALQAFGKPVLVFGNSCAVYSQNMNYPSVIASDPLSVARGIARASHHGVIAFLGPSEAALLGSMENISEDIVCICLDTDPARQRARSKKAKYCATASVAFPEDYMKKLLKCKSRTGLRFLDVHCPSPKSWGFDHSNTIEVASAAVNCGVWQLLECEGTSWAVTQKPDSHETVETYVKLFQKSLDVEMLKKIAAENM